MLTTTNQDVVEGFADVSTDECRQSGTLVIGIGNNLLTDDGAGIHVINLNYATAQTPDLHQKRRWEEGILMQVK